MKLLDVNSAQPGSEYINADYIRHLSYIQQCDMKHYLASLVSTLKSERKHQKFIATQGCLPNTIKDLWNMIWQENMRIIVMATNRIENGMQKCERYWPTQKEGTKKWGHAELTFLNKTVSNDFTLREFGFKWRNQEERRIYQFHIRIWPDSSELFYRKFHQFLSLF